MTRPFPRLSHLALLVCALVAFGCQKDRAETSDDSKASRPAQVGADVVATLVLDSGTQPAAFASIGEAVQPGAREQMKTALPPMYNLLTKMSLEAADLEAPVAFVVLNPKRFEMPVALRVKVKDKKALEKAASAAGRGFALRDGYAVVGDKAVVEAAQRTAFALPTAPSAIEGVVYPGKLMALYKEDIDKALRDMQAVMPAQQGFMGEFFAMYRDAVVAVADQSEKVVISIDAQGRRFDFNMRVVPKAGSTIAAFAKAQTAADFRMLKRLPRVDGNLVFAGDMRAGEAAKPLLKMATTLFARMFQVSPERALALMQDAINSMDGAMVGTMRMDVLNPTNQEMHFVYALNDADALRKAWREFAKLFEASKSPQAQMPGFEYDIDLDLNFMQHDGIEIDRYITRVSMPGLPNAMPGEAMETRMYIAAFDDVALMTTIDEASLPATLEALKSKSGGFALSSEMQAGIDLARARKESIFYTIDMASLAGGMGAMPFKSMAVGLGKIESDLNMRVSVNF